MFKIRFPLFFNSLVLSIKEKQRRIRKSAQHSWADTSRRIMEHRAEEQRLLMFLHLLSAHDKDVDSPRMPNQEHGMLTMRARKQLQEVRFELERLRIDQAYFKKLVEWTPEPDKINENAFIEVHEALQQQA